MTPERAGPLASVRSPLGLDSRRRGSAHRVLRVGHLVLGGRSSLGAELQNENVLSISLTIGSLSTRPGTLRPSGKVAIRGVWTQRARVKASIPPGISAFASLVLWLDYRVSPVPVSILALALFAVNPRLILYSAQLKPYTIDVLSTLLVCVCGYALRHHRYQWKWVAFFALVGCLLIWISFPIVFVLCGVGLTLMFEEWLAVGPVTPAASSSWPYLGWLLSRPTSF